MADLVQKVHDVAPLVAKGATLRCQSDAGSASVSREASPAADRDGLAA